MGASFDILLATRGASTYERLWDAFGEIADTLPHPVVPAAELLFDRIDELNAQIADLEQQMRAMVREHAELRRLTSIPGVGETGAMAVHAFAPSMETFRRGRDFAAWVGLAPAFGSTLEALRHGASDRHGSGWARRSGHGGALRGSLR